MAQTVVRTKPVSGNAAHQTVQYFYKRVNYNDVDITNSSRATIAVPIGGLPANAVALETHVRVLTAFTSGDIVIGTTVVNATTAGLSGTVVSTQDVTSGTTGYYVVDRIMGCVSTIDVPYYFYTATTGGSAGVADVWQYFVIGQAKE
jgi:hypothetical protein